VSPPPLAQPAFRFGLWAYFALALMALASFAGN